MLVGGRQEDYDSGHTDSPEEDAEADAYEDAMDNELESRIDRDRHKSAYRRQRIVNKMKEFAPESNKDNLMRTKHAIHELNNLHNGAELLKPEQKHALGHGEHLATKDHGRKEDNGIKSTLQSGQIDMKAHMDAIEQGNKLISDHELWIRQTRYAHELEMGRIGIEEKKEVEIPAMIRGIRERLFLAENVHNIPYFFERWNFLKYNCWGIGVGCTCLRDDVDEGVAKDSTVKSRGKRKQTLFPAKVYEQKDKVNKGRSRILKIDKPAPTPEIPYLKPLVVTFSDEVEIKEEEQQVKIEDWERPDFVREVVEGEVKIIKRLPHRWKWPQTPGFLMKYAPDVLHPEEAAAIMESKRRSEEEKSMKIVVRTEDELHKLHAKLQEEERQTTTATRGSSGGGGIPKTPRIPSGHSRSFTDEDIGNAFTVDDSSALVGADGDFDHEPINPTPSSFDPDHRIEKLKFNNLYKGDDAWYYTLFGGAGTYVYIGVDPEAQKEEKIEVVVEGTMGGFGVASSSPVTTSREQENDVNDVNVDSEGPNDEGKGIREERVDEEVKVEEIETEKPFEHSFLPPHRIFTEQSKTSQYISKYAPELLEGPLDWHPGYGNRGEPVYVLEGRELTRDEMYEQGRLDVEAEQNAQAEEKKEERKKKHVYFNMNDPMEDSPDIQFHDVYIKRAPEEERNTFNYIVFGGGGKLAGNFRRDVEKKTEEETEARRELVGTLHFDDGTVLRNNLHSIHEKLDLDMDLTSPAAVEHAKKVGWEESETNVDKSENGNSEDGKSPMYKRSDKTIAYVDKYAPDLIKTHPKARIDMEFHKFYKPKTRREIEEERRKYEKIQEAKQAQEKAERESRDLTSIFVAPHVQGRSSVTSPQFAPNPEVIEEDKSIETPLSTRTATTVSIKETIIDMGDDLSDNKCGSNIRSASSASPLAMDRCNSEIIEQMSEVEQDVAIADQSKNGFDMEEDEYPIVIEGIPSFNRRSTPKKCIMEPPNDSSAVTAEQLRRERTLRFIRRFCPDDEALFERDPDAYLGIKESSAVVSTRDGDPKRSIEVSFGGGHEGILEQSLKEDYIPVDDFTVSPTRAHSSHATSEIVASTPQSKSPVDAKLDKADVFIDRDEETNYYEVGDGSSTAELFIDQKFAAVDEREKKNMKSTEEDNDEQSVQDEDRCNEEVVDAIETLQEDMKSEAVDDDGDVEEKSAELEKSNVQIFGEETKRVLTDLKFNPDDPHEPNQEFFFEKPEAPTLWQTIFGGGGKLHIARDIADGSYLKYKKEMETRRKLMNIEVHEEIGADDYMSDISDEHDAATTDAKPNDVRIRTRTAEWSPARGWTKVKDEYTDYGFPEEQREDKEEEERKFQPAPPSPGPLRTRTIKIYRDDGKDPNAYPDPVQESTAPLKPVDKIFKSPLASKVLDPEFQDLINSTHEMLTPREPQQLTEEVKRTMPSTGNRHIDELNKILEDVDVSPGAGNASPATSKQKGKGTKEHLEKLKKVREEQLKEKEKRDAERAKRKKEREDREKERTPTQHRDRVRDKLNDIHAAENVKHKAMDDMLAKIDMHLATPKTQTPVGDASSDVNTKDPGEYFNASTPAPSIGRRRASKKPQIF